MSHAHPPSPHRRATHARAAAGPVPAAGAGIARPGPRFASPTTFRVGGTHHVPLPIPALMLGHWLDKWNAFSPLALHPDVRGFAEEQVAVNRYDRHTEPVIFGPATIIGFVGQCSLAVRHDAPYWRRIPHLLAAFSFWCGTGHKTTHGLGQTRPGR